VGLEKEVGVLAWPTHWIGSEKVLNMQILKKHYDALGSYLHVQTIKKEMAGEKIDFQKMRLRCEELISFIEDVLASSVFNFNVGNFTEIICANCGKIVRKRVPDFERKFQAKCHECQAGYWVVIDEKDEMKWFAKRQRVKCGNKKCDGEHVLWDHDIVIGKEWTCLECGGHNKLGLSIQYQDPA
jgi:hypothetical protein